MKNICNDKMFPKVSIVIPAYNASNYLAEAIDSALAQTYPNYEIIVVNDGSKDEGATAAVAKRYGDKIRYFEKENGGSSSALNVGIQNMTGEWFSWLSHDDLYVPQKLEKQMEYLQQMNFPMELLQKQVFFSAFDLIDGDGKTIRRANQKKDVKLAERLERFSSNAELIAEPTRYNFNGCSCLVHKSAFECVGFFDEKLRLLNDIDMWFRLYAAGYQVHYLPLPLVKGRIHAKQVSRSIGFSYHNSEQDWFWERSFQWLLEHCPEREDLIFLYGRNAYLKTRNVNGDNAFEFLKNSSRHKQILLGAKKTLYCLFASLRSFLKNAYLRLRV